MHKEVIDKLWCPRCQSSFYVRYILHRKKNIISEGILKCECSYYPIVEGILILKADKRIDKLLKIFRIDFLSILKWAEYKLKLLWEKRFTIFYSTISARKLKAIEVLSLYDNYKKRGGNLIYFKYRFCEQTFWLLYSLLPLFDINKDGYFLDLCAGVGHSSFIISKIKNPQKIICIERDLLQLIIAKKYFITNANLINYNIEDNLPFEKSTFSSVLFSDAFHYLNPEQKIHIAKEMERVSKKEGLIIILHAHNSLAQEVFVSEVIPQFAESPRFYAKLFKKFNCRIIPDTKLLEEFLFENRLDLKRIYPLDELKSAPGLSLIATSKQKHFDVFNNIDKYLLKFKEELVINPVYAIFEEEETFILKKHVSVEWVRIEYQFALDYMPDEIRVKKNLIKNLNNSSMDKQDIFELNNLIRRFVLINAPENFAERQVE